jgi:hypothetical protein
MRFFLLFRNTNKEREMIESPFAQIVRDFAVCFSGVENNPGFWARNHGDLMRFKGVIERRIDGFGLDRFHVQPNFAIAARILMAMHRSSRGAEGRIAAVNAIWALQAFVEMNVSREASAALVDKKQMEPIVAQYKIDREEAVAVRRKRVPRPLVSLDRSADV